MNVCSLGIYFRYTSTLQTLEDQLKIKFTVHTGIYSLVKLIQIIFTQNVFTSHKIHSCEQTMKSQSDKTLITRRWHLFNELTLHQTSLTPCSHTQKLATYLTTCLAIQRLSLLGRIIAVAGSRGAIVVPRSLRPWLSRCSASVVRLAAGAWLRTGAAVIVFLCAASAALTEVTLPSGALCGMKDVKWKHNYGRFNSIYIINTKKENRSYGLPFCSYVKCKFIKKIAITGLITFWQK